MTTTLTPLPASPPALSADPERWAPFVGSYELPADTLLPERALHVDLDGQTLFLTFRAHRMQCLPLSATAFACDAGVTRSMSELQAYTLQHYQAAPWPDESNGWQATVGGIVTRLVKDTPL